MRKWALTIGDLNTACCLYSDTGSHNNLLFCMQLFISFFALMWLGELTFPDNIAL